MSKLSLTVAHQLGEVTATDRLAQVVELARERYQQHVTDLETAWNGNALSVRFSAFGFQIRGGLTVEPAAVRVHGDLPLAAVMFRGQVERSIRDELGRILA